MEKTINFSEKTHGSWYVLKIIGRMDTITAPIAEDRIKAAIDDHVKVALDVSALEYISSAGLRVLLRAAKIADKKNKEIVICGAQGMVQEIFEDFDIEGFYTLYNSAEDLA